MKRTLYFYLIKELFPAFLLGLIGFTFILLTGRIVQLMELFVNKGVPLGVYLLVKAANESPVLLFVWLQRAVERFRPKRGEEGKAPR
jgi:lipopolysaccharide export system permease protein